MTNITIFAHTGGDGDIIEVTLPDEASLADAHHALKAAGIEVDKELSLFVDENEIPFHGEESTPLKSLKHGSHIHLCRCHRIKTTVNFLDRSIEHEFAPGTRVRRVKAWAVRHFGIEATDAGEHVLRLCNSTVEPPTDTPLHELTNASECRICFDLVPEKRVEG